MPEHIRLRTNGSERVQIGEGSDGIYSGKVVTDFSEGELVETARPLDFAITGNAFFRLIGEDDKIKVTRAGNLHLDDEGYLVAPSGEKVMGADGAAILLRTDQVVLGGDGALVDKDGQSLGKIGVWVVKDEKELERTDDNCFIAKTIELVELPSNDAALRQCVLEESNVDPVPNTLSIAKYSQGLGYYTNVGGMTKKMDERINEIVSQR
jgi:flagellar basal body rod protein FlgG